jgi:Lipocalin-like domain
MSAYSGTYRVEGNKLIVSIKNSSIESWNGTDRIPTLEFKGKTVTGTSAPFKSLVLVKMSSPSRPGSELSSLRLLMMPEVKANHPNFCSGTLSPLHRSATTSAEIWGIADARNIRSPPDSHHLRWVEAVANVPASASPHAA